jgi:hypothetical protein
VGAFVQIGIDVDYKIKSTTSMRLCAVSAIENVITHQFLSVYGIVLSSLQDCLSDFELSKLATLLILLY